MRYLGIDLGTTNIAVAQDGVALFLPTDDGPQKLLPSVVAFTPNRARLIGAAAKRRRRIDAKNTLYSTKRFIGRRYDSVDLAALQQRFPFELVETAGSGGIGFRTRAGTFTPVDVATMLLERVLAAVGPAEEICAAITVPAAFKPEQREATLEAAVRAGFKDVIVTDEPSATALAYTQQRGTAGGGVVAVYDLGGGTFDFAIVDCTQQPHRITMNEGDPFLGGDDIDDAIARWAAERMLELHRWELTSSPEVFERLVVECEAAKIRLSTQAITSIDLAEVDPTADQATGVLKSFRGLPIDRETLATLSSNLIRRTFVLCEQVLYARGLRPKDLDGVYVAGGGAMLPLVKAGIERVFGVAPRADISPLEVVSVGASHAARLAMGS